MKRVTTPTLGFLAITAVMMVIALAQRSGSIDRAFVFRGIVACLGLMTLLAGNFLPKLRPLALREGRATRIAGAERRAGWMLVLMGLALVGLAVLAPVELTRALAPIVALVGVGWIELDWIWAAWLSRPTPGEARVTRSGSEQRIIAAWLLFGLAYLLVTASLKFTFGSAGWARDLGAWIMVGFAFAYSVMQVLVPRQKKKCT